MTSDEALAVMGRNGPATGEQWQDFREREASAKAVLENLRGEELRSLVPRLARLLETTHLTTLQPLFALPLARATLELGIDTRFVERLAGATFTRPYLDALTRLDALEVDVWPLVETMLTAENPIQRDDLVFILSALFERSPDRMAARFPRILQTSPAAALSLCWSLQIWKQVPLGARKPFIVRFVLDDPAHDDALRIEALRLLTLDGELDDESRAAIEALFDTASLPLAEALAAFAVHQATARRSHPGGLLRYPRADVRRAAFNAFISPEKLPRAALPEVIAAWSDSDARIRETAERVLRQFCNDETLDPESLTAIVAQLEGRAEVAAFLAWVAGAQPTVRDWCLERLPLAHPVHLTLSRALTRVCARCRELARQRDWSMASDEPGAVAKLDRVATLEPGDWEQTSLLRCPECQAHFTLYERSEIDVNSRHDTWILTRVRFAELRARYAAHVDFDHPRVVTWLDAARADLQHVDPKVCADAEWELGDQPLD